MAIRETKDGYYVEAYLGINPITGKKDRATKIFTPKNRKNLAAAKAWEVKIKEDYAKGTYNVNGNVTLSAYLDDWFKTMIKGKKAYNTEKRYKVHIDCIKKHLGKVILNKLRTKMIDKFYSDLQAEMKTFKNGTTKRRYSNETILKTHKMFRMAIEQAVAWEMISKNYVDFAKPPASDTKEARSWPLKTVNDFLEYIKDEKIYLPCFIVVHTALREGEVCALRFKEDINFKKGYIAVNKTMVEKAKIGLELEDPKTESSKDIVYMTKDLKNKLLEVQRERKKHKLKTGIELNYVCCWEDDRPLRPTYISRRFRQLAEKFSKEKGIEPITFHGLRHSHATILYEHGADTFEISKQLRHSRPSTTENIYLHANKEIKKSTAQIFDKAVENSK